MRYLITGGAGFIGICATDYFLKKNEEVVILDDMSRKGSEKNIGWIKKHKNAGKLRIVKADISKDIKIIEEEISKADVVLHFAAQTAVTTSLVSPRRDFEINALGTFNILESIRISKNKPILMYSSTNKVYGEMEHVEVVEKETRHEFKDFPYGAGEDVPLDFHSAYGCSKGCADQYIRDYARIYGVKTVVFRQSCIYGTRQFGVEDQGWVAWFIIATVLGKPITIYGNGKQVRDLLFVDDLMELYDLAIQNIENVSGKVYNIGGGPNNTLSLLELLSLLEKLSGKKIGYSFGKKRQGDQPVFIADIRKAKKDLGWEPKIGVEEGVTKIYNWVKENPELFDA